MKGVALPSIEWARRRVGPAAWMRARAKAMAGSMSGKGNAQESSARGISVQPMMTALAPRSFSRQTSAVTVSMARKVTGAGFVLMP